MLSATCGHGYFLYLFVCHGRVMLYWHVLLTTVMMSLYVGGRGFISAGNVSKYNVTAECCQRLVSWIFSLPVCWPWQGDVVLALCCLLL